MVEWFGLVLEFHLRTSAFTSEMHIHEAFFESCGTPMILFKDTTINTTYPLVN